MQNQIISFVASQTRTEAEHVVPANLLCGQAPQYLDYRDFCPTGSRRNCATKYAPCSFAYTVSRIC
jgi:hypothetical protein